MQTPFLPHAAPIATPFCVSRRQWLVGTGAALSGWSADSTAQTPSEAQLELAAPPMPALGSRLQVPRIGLLNGQVFDHSQVAGQPLLIYWWSSTCPFCALQSPSMEALWREQKNKGLNMLALSIDRQPQEASAYLSKRGYTFPAAWASPAWRQTFPKPKGLPITLLLGRDGRLQLAEKGQMFAEDVQDIVQLLR